MLSLIVYIIDKLRKQQNEILRKILDEERKAEEIERINRYELDR